MSQLLVMAQWLTNRHITVALLVTPVLAIIGWYAVDIWVAPPPKLAADGGAYPLLAQSKCRYPSGRCPLVNGDIKVTLRVVDADVNRLKTPLKRPRQLLLEVGNLALTGARIEWLGQNQKSLSHQVFTRAASAEKPFTEESHWVVTLPEAEEMLKKLRFVMTVGRSHYFVETSAEFLKGQNR